MYRSPNLEFSIDIPSGRNLLILQTKKSEVPAAVAKGLPAHLKEHSAIRGDRGAKLALHGAPTRIVMGIGAIRDFTPQEAAEWGENAGQFLNNELITEIHVQFPADLDDAAVALNFLKGMALAGFRIDSFKSKSDSRRQELKKVYFSGGASTKLGKDEMAAVSAIVTGITFARDFIDSPSNSATPQGIVDRFEKAMDKKMIQLEVWDEKRIKKEGMGLLQAVSQGSEIPPRFLVARYGKDLGGKSKKSPLYLVGKGVTFDTGGINLKTVAWKELLAMKGDMAGAAAVLGAMLAISQIRPGIQVVAITPLTMNCIGSKAVIPGDIVKSYSGKTVEIGNTDAEGRLILADALHFAHEEKPGYIVDVATLTGACAIALGAHNTGLFSNNQDFADLVRRVAEASGEPAWQMPMSARYGEELRSKLADLSNMGKSREGGATLGAKFLENFVGNIPWCHLDIAGSADLGAPAAGGSQVTAAGRMVHTLVSLAQELASAKK